MFSFIVTYVKWLVVLIQIKHIYLPVRDGFSFLFLYWLLKTLGS